MKRRFDVLASLLEEARMRGLLGPGPVGSHIEHSLGFAHAWVEAAEPGEASPRAFVDLGSGAGIPGLILAQEWAEAQAALVESSARRAAFLETAIAALELGGRAFIVRARAEDVGREPRRRASVPLVVARGFGPPAVVAECAAPLLEVGGLLVVSEPPEPAAASRWPESGIRPLGLELHNRVTTAATYQVLRQIEACPSRYPRRTGIPAKRPLF